LPYSEPQFQDNTSCSLIGRGIFTGYFWYIKLLFLLWRKSIKNAKRKSSIFIIFFYKKLTFVLNHNLGD